MSVGEAANSNLERFGNDEHERWLKERAAGEMYEALREWGEELEDGSLCFCHSDTDVHTSRCLRCRSALAKAEGRDE